MNSRTPVRKLLCNRTPILMKEINTTPNGYSSHPDLCPSVKLQSIKMRTITLNILIDPKMVEM